MTRRRATWVVGALVGLAAIGAAASKSLESVGAAKSLIPTTHVGRESVDTTMHFTGELKATKAAPLPAPAVPGALRILKLAASGSVVKAGDPIVKFDPAEQLYSLEQARSEVQEAALEIEKLQTDAAVQAAKDKVDLLTARFDVRKAELDTRGNELVGAVQARKNELTLEEARRKLAQLEEDVRERATTSEAALAVAREKRTKAQIRKDQAERAIGQMDVVAPFPGIVSVMTNEQGGFFFGQQLPEYAEGDTVSPGTTVAEVLDITNLEVQAKAPEGTSAGLKPGQTAEINVHSLPDRKLSAKVKSVAGFAAKRMWFFGGGPVREFEVTFALDHIHPELRPGRTLDVRVLGKPLANVLTVPRQAVFERDGKPIVYAKTGDGFVARPIKVVQRTESRIVVEDVPEGTEIALADPESGAARDAQASRPTAVVSRP
jgi:HlyD family secretion protein